MLECPVIHYCVNSDMWCENCTGGLPESEWEASELPFYYKKADSRSPKHPYQLWKHRRSLAKKRDARRAAPVKANRLKAHRAAKNESNTRDTIIRATQRSGALNGDGDSRLGDGTLGIEDKLQSRSFKQFTVTLNEVDKAHKQGCLLVVTTAEGRKFVVSDLEFLILHADDVNQAFRNLD